MWTIPDGIEALVRPDQEEDFKAVQKLIEQEFNLVYEEDEYQFINYKTVNDYIALTTSGKIKCKGEFVWQDDARPGKKLLDGSNEFLVIPKAIEAYYIKGTPIEEFIKNHKDAYDFMAAKKVDKKYNVWYKGEIQQQLNRYYISTRDKGAYLYKQRKVAIAKKTKKIENQFDLFAINGTKDRVGNMENVLKDTPIQICNQTTAKTPKELGVDFDVYIAKANEQLIIFDNKQSKIEL